MRKFLYYFLWIFVLWWLLAIVYPSKFVNKKIKANKHVKKVYISNHVDFTDMLFHYRHFPIRPLIMCKKELMKGGTAPFMRIFNAVPVDRGTTDLRAIREVLGGMEAGQSLLLFPEGTRNRADDGQIKEVKGGAAMFAIKTKTPLIPIMIHHKSRIFRRNYLYYGQEFELSEFYDVPLNSQALKDAGCVLAQHLQEEADKLEKVMQQKYGHKKWYQKMCIEREKRKAEAQNLQDEQTEVEAE